MQYRVRGNDGRERSVSLAALQTAYASARPGDATVMVRTDAGEDVPVLLSEMPDIARGRTAAPTGANTGPLALSDAQLDQIADRVALRLAGGRSNDAGRSDLSFVRSEIGDDRLAEESPFMAEVERVMTANPRLSLRDAGEKVARRNPDLWHQHREVLAGSRLPRIKQANNRHLN